MAEDDDMGFDEGGSSPAPAKKSGIGGLFTGLLKWIIIGIASVIVIVVIVVIALSIYDKKRAGGNSQVNSSKYLEEYTLEAEEFDWYKSIGTIQTFTSEEPPATVRATVYLGYKKDDKATSAEITGKSVELKEFLRVYFRGKTAAELKNVNNEEKFKIEIRNGINDKILSKSKIRSISFDQLDVVEQN